MALMALQSAEQIRKNILDRFYWDSRIEDYSNIEVEFAQGKVMLRGSVPSHAARRFAEQDAHAVPGVDAVDNQLRIKFKDTMKIPSDRDVEDNIRSILQWNSAIDESRVGVSVNAGHLTLEGTVRSYYQKFRAQELAGDVIGVMKVDNRIAVVPSASHSDEAIGRQVVAAVKNALGVDADRLTIMAREGVVTLSGTVPDMIAFHAVINICRCLRGVVDVHNLLAVADDRR